MSLMLEIEPELEARVREEAAKVGMDPDAFVLNTLEERLRRGPKRKEAPPAHLSGVEAQLLQKINTGLPEEMWREYHHLVARRRSETLTPEEHARLIAISDEIETAHVQRIQLLEELARLRNISLEALMKQLGIEPIIRKELDGTP